MLKHLAIATLALGLACCSSPLGAQPPTAPASSQPATASPAAAGKVVKVGQVKFDDLDEASGLAPCSTSDDIFWSHNDGDDGVLFAIRKDGSLAGKFRISANFKDWEDIAHDREGNLYLADTGNNDADRERISVHRIAEPTPGAGGKLAAARTWALAFPGKPFNCESLFIVGSDGYLISKTERGERATVYRFSLTHEGKKKQTLEEVCRLPIDEPVTAADISADGKRLAVLTRGELYVFAIDGDVKKAADATLGRFAIPHIQTEGCCFVRDGVMIIAETGEIFHLTLEQP